MVSLIIQFCLETKIRGKNHILYEEEVHMNRQQSSDRIISVSCINPSVYEYHDEFEITRFNDRVSFAERATFSELPNFLPHLDMERQHSEYLQSLQMQSTAKVSEGG